MALPVPADRGHSQPPTRDELLSALRGQSLRVPDLAPLLAGWPNDVSPHLDIIDVKILQMIESSENISQRIFVSILTNLLGMLLTKRCEHV
jgi:hypothetical protein